MSITAQGAVAGICTISRGFLQKAPCAFVLLVDLNYPAWWDPRRDVYFLFEALLENSSPKLCYSTRHTAQDTPSGTWNEILVFFLIFLESLSWTVARALRKVLGPTYWQGFRLCSSAPWSSWRKKPRVLARRLRCGHTRIETGTLVQADSWLWAERPWTPLEGKEVCDAAQGFAPRASRSFSLAALVHSAGMHGHVVYIGNSGVSARKPLPRHCRPLSPVPFRAKQIATLSSWL